MENFIRLLFRDEEKEEESSTPEETTPSESESSFSWGDYTIRN